MLDEKGTNIYIASKKNCIANNTFGIAREEAGKLETHLRQQGFQNIQLFIYSTAEWHNNPSPEKINLWNIQNNILNQESLSYCRLNLPIIHKF